MKHFSTTLSLSLALAGGLVSSAHADLMYQQTMPMGGATITSYFQGKSHRVESGAFGSKSIILTTCGSSTVTRINPDLKIYTTEAPSFGKNAKFPAGAGKLTGAAGVKSVAIVVKDLGATKVNGKAAHHWKISNNMQMQNGRSVSTDMEIWSGTTPIPTCPGETAQALSRLPQMQGLNSKVKLSGDVGSMNKAMATVPLKMVMYFGGRPLAEVETTSISAKPLSSSLFKAPSGYKKVSAAQYDAAVAKAMQAKFGDIMKQMGKMGGMPGGMPHGMPGMNH